MTRFSKEFTWGAATSAYQIEGAAFSGGKGASIWDAFCEQPGAIRDHTSGAIACNHIQHFKEDVDLMSKIGLQSYRFSISWPRVLPEGTGAINQKGLDFYDQLIDALLEKNIDPFITLFHWDLPLSLHQKGGWLNPDSAQWFGDYAALLSERFSDRVENWFTINEPQIVIGLGYHTGSKAPGYKLPLKEVLLALHNSLLAHGRAVQALRDRASRAIKIGPVSAGSIAFPSQANALDIESARQATFFVHGDQEDRHDFYKWNFPMDPTWNFSWYTDPVFLGQYPEQGLEILGSNVPKYTDADMAIINQPVDFCGLNLYSGYPVKSDVQKGWVCAEKPTGFPVTAFKWPVTPEILYWGPKYFYERYGKPIYITENGMSAHDWPNSKGEVEDPQRIHFLKQYLKQYKKASEDGVPVLGYFLWSLMDNFEWEQGYEERFGIIHVDFQTQARRLKSSAKWYSETIRSNGAHL